MSYHLFLDDIRNPGDVTWIGMPSAAYHIVRDYAQFVSYIGQYGVPDFVAFDHDLAEDHYAEMLRDCQKNSTGQLLFEVSENLKDHDYGPEKTGYDCAKWLVGYCRDKSTQFPEYVVHSMNPVGKARIEAYVANARKTGFI